MCYTAFPTPSSLKLNPPADLAGSHTHGHMHTYIHVHTRAHMRTHTHAHRRTQYHVETLAGARWPCTYPVSPGCLNFPLQHWEAELTPAPGHLRSELRGQLGGGMPRAKLPRTFQQLLQLFSWRGHRRLQGGPELCMSASGLLHSSFHCSWVL